MDYRICSVRKNVNACDCTLMCPDTVRESALKVDWEKNPLPHQEKEPALAACRSDALPTELHPHPCFLFVCLFLCLFLFFVLFFVLFFSTAASAL